MNPKFQIFSCCKIVHRKSISHFASTIVSYANIRDCDCDLVSATVIILERKYIFCQVERSGLAIKNEINMSKTATNYYYKEEFN